MPRLTKKDKAHRYSSWIQMGERHQEFYTENWERFEHYLDIPYFGNLSDDEDRDKDYQLPYNKVWLNIKSLLPLLTHGEPIPIVTPLKENIERSAKMMEQAILHFHKVTEFSLEIRMCVLDAIIYNLAFFKQGYYVDYRGEEETIKTGKGPLDILREGMERDMSAEEINRRMFKGIMDHDDSAELSLAESPLQETWWGERVDPRMILLPPTCTYKMDSAPWLIHKIVKPTYDAIKLFPQVDQLKPTHVMEFGFEEEPIGVDAFEIYEIWDKTNPRKKKVVYIIASGTDRDKIDYHFLKEIEWIGGLNGFPISRLSFNCSPRKFWLPPDLYMYEHFAQTLSELLSNQLGATRKERRYIGYNPDKAKREEAEHVAHGPDGTVYEAEGPDAIWEHDTHFKQLDFGFHNLLERITDQSSGLDEFYRGSSSRVESATEATYIKQGGQIRIDDMVVMVERFMGDIYTKMGKIVQEYLSGPLAVRVSPEIMQEFQLDTPWANLGEEDIAGDFLYKIRPGTLTRETNETRKRKFFDFYNLAYQDPYMQPIELRKLLIENYFDQEIDPMQLLKVGMAGQTEQAIMLEHMLAMRGMQIPPPNSQEDHAAHIDGHTAFIENPPQEIQMRMAAAQNQEGGETPETQGAAAAQAQEVAAGWQGVAGIVQQHIEETQALVQEQTGPLDYNQASEARASSGRSELPEQPRQAETSIALG